MEKDYSFLPHFLNENIYLVKENMEVYSHKDSDLSSEKNNSTPAIKQEEKVESRAISSSDIKFKGKNLKKILLVVDQPTKDFIIPEEEVFLKRILTAVKLSSDDVAIVNLQNLEKNQIGNLLDFDFAKLITFGVENDNFISGDIPLYDISNINDRKILKADSLDMIQKDQKKKAKLWEILQKLFLV
jgi:hypothetical protein